MKRGPNGLGTAAQHFAFLYKRRRSRRNRRRHVMKRLMIATLAVLIPVTSAFAHHRFGDEFDAKAPITLKGTVTKVEWGNPHVMIYADGKDKEGHTEKWGFEAAGPALMEIKGLKQEMFRAGEEISV